MADSPEYEPFLSLKEAARFLSVSPGFIYKYSRSIPHVKIGGEKTGKLLFLASELAQWAESRRVVRLEPVKVSA